jgi:hypothetical protein
MSSLLPKLMKLGRAGSRSDRACEETNRQLDRIIPGIEMFRRGGDYRLAANERMTSSAHPGNFERSLSITENETTTKSQPSLSYGPPWARYLGGYQDRLLGRPLVLT